MQAILITLISVLGTGLFGVIAMVYYGFRSDISDLKGELKADNAELRGEVGNLVEAVQGLGNKMVTGLADLEVRFSEKLATGLADLEVRFSEKLGDLEVRFSEKLGDLEVRFSEKLATGLGDLEVRLTEKLGDLEVRLSDKIAVEISGVGLPTG